MKNTKLLRNLESKIKGELPIRRYSLPEIISESYNVYYESKENSNLQKLAEAHLNDVRSNPSDIDRLSRQLCVLKRVSTLVESRRLSDKDLIESPRKRRVVESKRIGSKVRRLKETRDPENMIYDEEDVEQKDDENVIDEAEEVELTDEEAEELAKHLSEIRKKKGIKESKKSPKRKVEESAEDRVVSYGIDIINPPQDIDVPAAIQKAVEDAGLAVAGCAGTDTSWSAKEYGLSESKKSPKRKVEESNSWKSLKEGMKNFNKVSSNKAFYKTFKKMQEALKEGRALTRQESISLYKAANSAMTHLSVELEHNPEFLATFKECTSLLSTDVNSILGSLKEGKAPSKKTMKSLSKFAESLLREADEDEEDIPAIEDEEGESIDAEVPEDEEIPDEEEFVGDEEGDIVSEEEEEFDQEYADARVELHKELADKHEEDEDPGIQDKLAQDAEEVTNLPGITDEQIAEITGEEVDSEDSEEEEEPEEEESEEEETPEEEDDSDITDDELAELKKHLTEMRKAKKIRESKGRRLKRRK